MDMSNELISNWIAVVASNYAKRFLEGRYTQLFQSDMGKELKKLNIQTKYVMEFILYSLSAIADRRISENSPLKKFIKEVGGDIAPEIAKRLINGDAEYSAFSELLPENEALLNYLLEIEEADLQQIVSSLKNTHGDSQSEVLKDLLLQAKAGLKKISFSSETQKGFLETVNDRLRKHIQRKKEGK